MDKVQLSQGCRATAKRQSAFTAKYPGNPGTHLIDPKRRKAWSTLDLPSVFNSEPLNES